MSSSQTLRPCSRVNMGILGSNQQVRIGSLLGYQPKECDIKKQKHQNKITPSDSIYSSCGPQIQNSEAISNETFAENVP